MESTTGRITATRWVRVGTTLEVDHPAGSSVLAVVDPYPFDEDGGTLDVNGVTYAYTGWDDDTSSITLATGLTADAEAGDDVLLLPAESVMVAVVVEDESGEQIEADVRQSDAADLPEGTFNPGVAATLGSDGDGWVVSSITGRTPTPDAGLLSGTLPDSTIDGTQFAADVEEAKAGIDAVQEFGWITARIVEGDVIATAFDGQRVQISMTGIAAYNDAETLTAALTAADGGLELQGELILEGTTAKIRVGALGGRRVEIRDGAVLSYQTPDPNPNVPSYVAELNAGYLRFRQEGTADVIGAVRVLTDGIRLQGVETVIIQSNTGGSYGDLRLLTVGGYEAGKIQTNQVYSFQASTSNSRSVFVNGNTGYLHTDTSTRDRKDEIETLKLDLDHYFSGRAVSYVDKEQLRAHRAGEKWMTPDGTEMPVPAPEREWGRIAEEVHDLGYPELVDYEDGKPAGLKYPRETSALYYAGQVHHRDIAALKAENMALREELAAQKKSRGDLEVKVTAQGKQVAALAKKLGVTI
jgi:hypothetical protein